MATTTTTGSNSQAANFDQSYLFAYQGRPAHYFEAHADRPILPEQDANTLGWTAADWLSHNARKPIGAYVDDHHSETPIGEVISTGLGRDVKNPSLEMLTAGAVIYRDTARGKELSDKVAKGEIKSVSIHYKAEKDPYTGRKRNQHFVALGLHTNPHDTACVITRQKGANDNFIELHNQRVGGSIIAVPIPPELQKQPNIDATKATDTSSGASQAATVLPTPALMAATTPPAVVPPAAAGAPAPQQPPAGAPAAGVPAAVVPPQAGTPAVVPPAAAKPDAMDTTPTSYTPAQTEAMAKKLLEYEAMSKRDLYAKAARGDVIAEEAAKLREENAKYMARFAEEDKKAADGRLAEILKFKDHLKTLGHDPEDPAVKKELEDWAADAAKAPKPLVRVIDSARKLADAQVKEKEASEKKAHEQKELERSMLEATYGKQVVDQMMQDRAAKAARTESHQPGQPAAQPMTGVQTTTPPAATQQPPTQQQTPQDAISQLAALQQQLLGTSNIPPSSIPQIAGFQRQTTADLIAAARRSVASASRAPHQDPSIYERINRLDSPAAQLFEKLQSGRVGIPLEVKQGADGGVFTGQVLNATGDFNYGQVRKLAHERPGSVKDIVVAEVLSTDGKTFTSPFTGEVFDIEHDILHSGQKGCVPQRFGPDVVTAVVSNLYSAGEGAKLPASFWYNGGNEGGGRKGWLTQADYGNVAGSKRMY